MFSSLYSVKIWLLLQPEWPIPAQNSFYSMSYIRKTEATRHTRSITSSIVHELTTWAFRSRRVNSEGEHVLHIYCILYRLPKVGFQECYYNSKKNIQR